MSTSPSSGEKSKDFFVIISGTLKLDDEKKVLKRGDSFGESGFWFNQRETSSFTAATPCKVCRLTRYDFDKIVMDPKRYIDSLDMFRELSTVQKDSICTATKIAEYSRGEEIVHKGESSDYFYVILKGAVKANGKVLKQHDYFGHELMMSRHVHRATVAAVTRTVLLAITATAFQSSDFSLVRKVLKGIGNGSPPKGTGNGKLSLKSSSIDSSLDLEDNKALSLKTASVDSQQNDDDERWLSIFNQLPTITKP